MNPVNKLLNLFKSEMVISFVALLKYLRGTGGHKECVRPSWMIVVVHGRSHVKSHELQSRYEARQAAVSVF